MSSIASLPDYCLDTIYDFFKDEPRTLSAFASTCKKWKAQHDENRRFQFLILFMFKNFVILSTNLPTINWLRLKHCNALFLGENFIDDYQQRINTIFLQTFWTPGKSSLWTEKKQIPGLAGSLRYVQEKIGYSANHWDRDRISLKILKYLDCCNHFANSLTKFYISLEEETNVRNFLRNYEILIKHLKINDNSINENLQNLIRKVNAAHPQAVCLYLFSQSRPALLYLLGKIIVLKLDCLNWKGARLIEETNVQLQNNLFYHIKNEVKLEKQPISLIGINYFQPRENSSCLASMFVNKKISFISIMPIQSKVLRYSYQQVKKFILNYNEGGHALTFSLLYLYDAVDYYEQLAHYNGLAIV